MENILDGTTISSLIESVTNILGISTDELNAFIHSQRYRVRYEGGAFYYDGLPSDVIFDYFRKTPDDIQFDAITVSHVASVIDEQTFYHHGMLSLKDLFLTETPFKAFMLEYGITPVAHKDGSLQILVNGEPKSSDYIDNRLNRDRRINGFLFGDNPESDENISEMLKCPEFISVISREILHDLILIEEWMNRSIPSVITFKALISEIHGSTNDSYEDMNSYLLCRAVERLLFFVTHYPNPSNPMIYLKEHINIGAERILEIRKLNTPVCRPS